jgi:hypothetical protein
MSSTVVTGPEPDPHAASVQRDRRRCDRLFFGLVVFHLVLGAVVVAKDKRILVRDESHYFNAVADVSGAVRRGDLAGSLRLFVDFERPLVGLLPAIIGQTVWGGLSPAPARAGMLIWLALLLFATYRIGIELHSPAAGVLAASVLGAMPLALGYSRMLGVDAPNAALSALAILTLLRTRCFRDPRGSVLFGLVAGIGFVNNHALLIFVGPVTLAHLAVGLRRRAPRARVLLSVALGALTFSVFLVALGWYYYQQILSAFSRAHHSVGGLYYFFRVPLSSVGPLLSLLYLIGCAGLLARDRRRLLATTGLWLWGALALLTQFQPWDRYAMPALPAAALVIGAGLCDLGRRWRSRRLAVPALVGLSMLIPLQQSTAGPFMFYCPTPHNVLSPQRALCAGLVRPLPQTPQPDIRWLKTLNLRKGGSVLIVPSHIRRVGPIETTPVDDDPLDALQYWLLLSSPFSVKVDLAEELKQLDIRWMKAKDYIFIADPGPREVILPSDRYAYDRVKKVVRSRQSCWIKTKELPLLNGRTLSVYRRIEPRSSLCL